MSNDPQSYTDVNAAMIDHWVAEGWEWGRPISHEQYVQAMEGRWQVLLTPCKPVPAHWFGDLRGKRVLGLASGGGQQMPLFAAAGAVCTVLDYTPRQLENERMVAQREGYAINIVRGDMSKPLPFADESFDLIFHPVSNCYVQDVCAVWRECARILAKGGRLLSGLDNGIAYAFDDDEQKLVRPLPFDPLKDEELYEQCVKNDWGIQFSHTIEEQIGGQLRAGLTLLDVYGDLSSGGGLAEHNVPGFWCTLSQKS